MQTNSATLNELINQSIRELKNDFKYSQDGKYKGWHQFIGSVKIGNVATSQGLLLLNAYNEDIKDRKKASNFLVDSQQKSQKRSKNGGWSFISNIPSIPNTESTCWALQALAVEGIEGSVDAGVKWLMKNFINGSFNSGWGPSRKSGIRVYSTCIVLNTLKVLNVSNEKTTSAFETLKRIQNIDGGWGEKPRGKSTLTHTAHAVITLLNYGMDPSSRAILMAVRWMVEILKSKNYKNSFAIGYSEMFDFIYMKKGKQQVQRLVYYHMPIAYSILALMKAQYNDKEFICENVLVLMQQNDFGIWLHPLLLEKPLWAMYDVLTVFNQFKNSDYYHEFDNIKVPPSKRKYDVLIFTVVPIEFYTLNKILNFAPNGKREDFSLKGFWYYEYQVERDNGKHLDCLITMVGSAGDIGCYAACSTAFESFECDLAILCGIAAGNKNELTKYDALIASSVIAYEYQRLEKEHITYRPKTFQLNTYTSKILTKIDVRIPDWSRLLREFVTFTGIDTDKVDGYAPEKAKLKTGVIASGAKLIADELTLEILREKIPVEKGIIAAEMEGSGFAPCCIEYNKEWLIIRGISDYGESDKNDPKNKEYQPLAVAAAAASTIYYLKYFHRTITER